MLSRIQTTIGLSEIFCYFYVNFVLGRIEVLWCNSSFIACFN